MVSRSQKKGVMVGLMWGIMSWVPYYTDYLGGIRGVLGIPAALGLNLELLLGKGDAFVYSLLLSMGLGFFAMTMFQLLSKHIKVIGFLSIKKKRRLLRKGF